MSERYDASRRRGYRDEFAGGGDDGGKRWVDYMAHAAEGFMLEYLGAGVRRVSVVDHRDPGMDLVWRGWSIDVKWTPQEPGARGYRGDPVYPGLRVPTWKPRRADLYVLVLGDMAERFRLFTWADGWTTREDVEAADVLEGRTRYTSGKPAPFYFIGFDYLHPLQALRDIPEKGPGWRYVTETDGT